MLANLLAAGALDSGGSSVVVTTPARRTAYAIVGNGASSSQDTAAFLEPLDPSDQADFIFSFGGDNGVLVTGETITTYVLAVTAQGAALGLTIMSGVRAPTLSTDGNALQFWLMIDPAFQANSAFVNGGLYLSLQATIVTSAGRTREQSVRVRVVQR